MEPRIFLTTALIILGFFAPEALEVLSLPVFVISIVTIGMLHGGLDHITAFRHFNMQHNKSKWRYFLAGYMGIIAAYGIIWLISPLIGLALFILMSCYHFGQLDMHEFARKKTSRFLYLSRGVYLLGMMITAQIAQVSAILQPLQIGGSFEAFISEWQALLISAICIQHLFALWFATTKLSLRLAVDTIATGLMFGLLPPLLSFGLYFALWHSWDHLKLLREYLRIPEWKSLALKAMPFTLMALAGIAAIILLFRQSLSEPGTVIFVLVGISLLTMPHMLLVDRIVEHDHEIKRPE